MGGSASGIPGIVSMAANVSESLPSAKSVTDFLGEASGALSGSSATAGSDSPIALIQKIGAGAAGIIAGGAERSLARTAARQEVLRGRRIALDAQEQLNRVLAGQAVATAASGVGGFGGSGLALAGDAAREAGFQGALANADARIRSTLLKGEAKQANRRANQSIIDTATSGVKLASKVAGLF